MIAKPFRVTTPRHGLRGFTLTELLISVVVITFVILIVAQLMTSATAITRTGSKHIDTDTQARIVFDRMAVDFGKMLKRTDIDYYVKAPVGYKNPKAHGQGKKLQTGQQGNDQIAFFSQVSGYYPSGAPSPISLVAYRLNEDNTSASYLKLERMGKGLLWNGVDNPNRQPNQSQYTSPIVFLPLTIGPSTLPSGASWRGAWAAAVSSTTADSDYETIGPQVFRFEYYYLLKDGSVTDVPATSWDLTKTASANLNAFIDVEAIAVAIAVVDPASRSLLYDPSTPGDPWHRLFSLASDMADFKTAPGNGNGGAKKIGDLEDQWNTAVQNAVSAGKTDDGSSFPPAAASAIRIYNRYFDLKTF